MKTLNTYINEKLVLNKDTFKNVYNYYPKDKFELREILKKLLEDRGPNADLNDIDISKIKDLGYLNNDKGLFTYLYPKNINISQWNVSNVSTLEGLFYDCRSIENIDISNWNILKCTNIKDMFAFCRTLKSIGNISKWKTVNICNMSYTFYQCNNINNIGDISNWDISSCDNFEYMFYGCHKLKTLGDLTDWQYNTTNNLDEISKYMFKNTDILSPIPFWYNG